MSFITIQITDKTYPAVGQATQKQAIANLSIGLHEHEFVCLVGPSGCGKTSLLNIIAGLDHIYEGSIQMGSRLTHPKIAYVFQNPRLLPWRTVRENIELVQDNLVADDIDRLLDAMQLNTVQQVYPERLSLGMSRRVAIVRAFAIAPELLLMDEPFVSLDAPSARQARNLLVNLWQQRPHTVLFVTHDLREAITLADRIIFLSSSPMRVITEVKVPLTQLERCNEDSIEAFRQTLKQEHSVIHALL
ncbi:MAG: ATP-binding cassette domain-containing protein [Methylovulum sp.]|jgi:NitT/TauT family transport system ATP-binding protein|nr:ATP-binding cassette domain-containing protein [Methylovulum sp.]MCF7997504.1 ATP-binding cassette domain-containing protein [Methylovulum sp.]MCF8006664.1 ATP-binding cassette domain-containing protein [Methylovulum sp.]